jgi:hypothetical protein
LKCFFVLEWGGGVVVYCFSVVGKFRKFISRFRARTVFLASGAVLLLVGAVGVVAYARWSNQPRCIKGDCRWGQGTLLYRDGSRYEGNFRDGRFHRSGLFFSISGHHYEGDWRDGRREGVGRLAFPGGGLYVGEFKNDRRHGPGTYTWPDGTKYAGAWRHDSPEGRGVLILGDGTRLAGEYRDGTIYNGTGMKIYSDGRRYIGQWRRGHRHGQGMLLDPEGGPIQSGTWSNDEFVDTNN